MRAAHGSPVTGCRSTPVDVRGALREAMARLRAAGVPSHTLAAELLLMHVLGRDRAWVYAHPDEPLAPEAAETYFGLVTRRAAGTPTQYLTGRQEFWGLEFEVTPAVLIPRPESEHVVEVALERMGPATWRKELARRPIGEGLRIADVGTGSGCLAIALARELPGAEVVATDVSAAALEVARRNAVRLGAVSCIEFIRCSLLNARLDSPPYFDLVVSNPPYIARPAAASLPREVREHEPAEALYGGERGTELYAPLVEQAERLLREGGHLVVELGHDSRAGVRPLVENSRWTRVAVTNDLAGIPRVLAAEKA